MQTHVHRMYSVHTHTHIQVYAKKIVQVQGTLTNDTIPKSNNIKHQHSPLKCVLNVRERIL